MERINNFIEFNKGKIIFFIVLLELSFLTFFNFSTERVIMHSDTATEILNTKEILETGNLVPKDWWSPDQIWILGPNLYHLVFTPFIRHALNLHTAAGVLNSILLFMALYLVMRISKVSRFASLVVISIVFSGMSYITTDDLFGQFVYGVALTNTFLVILLLFLFVKKCKEFFSNKNELDRRKFLLKAVLPGLLLFLFNVLVSLSGNRYIFVVSLPLVLTILTLFVLQKNDKSTKKTFVYSILIIAVSAFIGNYLLVHYIAPGAHLISRPGLSSFTTIEKIDQNLPWIFNSFLYFTGSWEPSIPGTNVFSIKGMLAFYKFFLFLFITLVPVYLAINFYKIKNLYFRFLLTYTFVLAALILYSTMSFQLLEPGGTARYYLCIFIPIIVLFGFFIDNFLLKNSSKITELSNLYPYWVIVLLLPLYISSYFQFVAPKMEQERHPLQPMTDFLTDHGIKYGYAGFWKAHMITILSDYNVRIRQAVFDVGGVPSRYKWLESDRWYSPEYYKGETALILSQEDYDKLKWELTKEKFGEPIKEYNFDGNKIFVYDYNIAEKMQ